jgi:hypothetical protein
MLKRCTVFLALAVLVCTGCKTTRPISDSEYTGGWGHSSHFGRELSEVDILDVAGGEQITQEELAAEPVTNQTFTLRKGTQVLLIQSGALFPDEPMQRELDKFLKVAPFSGIAPTQDSVEPNLSKSLRRAALKGGYDYIVCYWGILEAEQKGLPTGTASWTPIVGKYIPDETQSMRIRLKMLVMDVRTGCWIMLQSAPDSTSILSARSNRELKDQKQVQYLKEKGYTELAGQLLKYVIE